MAWERRGQQDYYYRHRKVDGRVIKTYLGRGPEAEAAAQAVADAKLRRKAERAERARYEAAADLITELDRQCDAVLSASLLAYGYYRHDRGTWRKRHGKK